MYRYKTKEPNGNTTEDETMKTVDPVNDLQKKSRISCWCGVLYIWTYIPRKSVSFLYWIGSIPSSICVIIKRFLAYVTKEACKLHLVSRAVIFFSYLHIQKAKQVRRITLSNVIFCQKTKKSLSLFRFWSFSFFGQKLHYKFENKKNFNFWAWRCWFKSIFQFIYFLLFDNT